MTPAPERAVKGTYGSMPATTERARIVMARKIVSAVVAPTPTRKPARHDRVTVCEAMTAFTGPGRRREGEADPDAGEDRHDHVEGHGAAMSRGTISMPREPL